MTSTWRAATIQEVEAIVATELADCDPAKLAIFRRYAVLPHYMPIMRSGQLEQVIVVARKDNEVMFWEDIEEGFEISTPSHEGIILDYGASQNNLSLALYGWLEHIAS